MKKLEQYYATPELDTSLDKLHACAKKAISSKNIIESDTDSSVEEVGSVPKDTSGSGHQRFQAKFLIMNWMMWTYSVSLCLQQTPIPHLIQIVMTVA